MEFHLKSLLKSLLRITLGVALAIPLVLYPLLYFLQEKLLFHPRPLPPAEQEWARKAYPGAEITLTAADGVTLHGWFVAAKSAQPAPLLMYFGGNAEEVSGLLGVSKILPGWSLLLINYRGYGLSGGEPGEKALLADALLQYDHFARHPAVDKQRIAVMGRSLGSGVAVYLAEQRPVSRVVLISPFDSIQHLAQRLYPYVPMGLLLKHPFDSLSRAPAVTAPVIALIGERDGLIPPAHSEALLAQWGGPVTVKRFPAADHNSIAGEPEYWPVIRGFLER